MAQIEELMEIRSGWVEQKVAGLDKRGWHLKKRLEPEREYQEVVWLLHQDLRAKLTVGRCVDRFSWSGISHCLCWSFFFEFDQGCFALNQRIPLLLLCFKRLRLEIWDLAHQVQGPDRGFFWSRWFRFIHLQRWPELELLTLAVELD